MTKENKPTINVSTPASIAAQGLTEAPMVPAATIGNVSAASRQFAEVKGMIELARQFPRNEVEAFTMMRRVCQRARFADDALYAYPRGGEVVSGASIRLIEMLVQAFRNIDYGFRIMEMQSDRSLVEAYAWDTESNIKTRREFWVLHIRETKGGGYAIESQRDIYELCANMAQRRVRSCIEQMLPIDLVEEAKDICRATMAGGSGTPFEDRVREMTLAYGEIGVTVDMIEGYLGHNIKAIVVEELPKLRQAYNSIQNGIAKRDDFFDVPPPSASMPEPVATTAPKPEVSDTAAAPKAKNEEQASDQFELQRLSSKEIVNVMTGEVTPAYQSGMSDAEKAAIEAEEAAAYASNQQPAESAGRRQRQPRARR